MLVCDYIHCLLAHGKRVFIELYETVAICLYLGGSVIWKVLSFKDKMQLSNSFT